jgi:hypothetical protein
VAQNPAAPSIGAPTRCCIRACKAWRVAVVAAQLVVRFEADHTPAIPTCSIRAAG